MVAQERHQRAPTLQCDHPLEDPPAVRTPIDVITQRDEDVLGSRRDRSQQDLQGPRTTENIPDGNRSRRHELSPRHDLKVGPSSYRESPWRRMGASPDADGPWFFLGRRGQPVIIHVEPYDGLNPTPPQPTMRSARPGDV